MQTKICLNMIVKNETPVLERLFNSVKDIIDYYVIVDTGSTDGTPEFIRQWMETHSIAGEVYCHDWVNFSVNRNQALQYAYQCQHADWLLIIDADEEIICTDKNFYKNLTKGTSYYLEKTWGELKLHNLSLIDISQTTWQWQGVVHEYLECVAYPTPLQTLANPRIFAHVSEGARSQTLNPVQKFLDDALLLENALAKNPTDPRNRFYLAQSYRDAGQLELAYQQYFLRAAMSDGWIEETFFAQYQVGVLAILLNKPHSMILEALLKAYEIRPTRAESLHELARYCRNKNLLAQAYIFAKIGTQIAYPAAALFVKAEIYQWQLWDELAVAAYWLGKYQESKQACEEILNLSHSIIPSADLARVQANLDFSLAK
jgi:hypothetical protein